MAIICPRCNSKNVKQVARRMKTRYGRVTRRFRCENCDYTWTEEEFRKTYKERIAEPALLRKKRG